MNRVGDDCAAQLPICLRADALSSHPHIHCSGLVEQESHCSRRFPLSIVACDVGAVSNQIVWRDRHAGGIRGHRISVSARATISARRDDDLKRLTCNHAVGSYEHTAWTIVPRVDDTNLTPLAYISCRRIVATA